jgi:tRNA pseudouridine38-40 synthase
VQRYAFKVFYEGTKPFYGSQRQPNIRTVEGDLIRALMRTHALPSEFNAARFASAGRTDRYVSALGNVFAVNAERDLTPAAVNSKMGSDDIRVWASARVSDSFNPRRALKRHYKYFACAAEGMDLGLLIETSKLFVGVHDFRSFAHRPSKENSIREITDFSLVGPADNFICFSIIGDSFLRRMVRKIVGALLYVALGLLKPTEIQQLFDPRNPIPRMGVPSAPAEGLVLWDVDYGFPFEVDGYAVKKLRVALMKSIGQLVIKKVLLNELLDSTKNGLHQE